MSELDRIELAESQYQTWKQEQLPEVRRIPIDPNGKQLLIIRGMDSSQALSLVDRLREWYNSDEPVGAIYLESGEEIEFIRVKSEEGE